MRLPLEVGRALDAAVAADIDRRMPEHARQEHRHRDIGRVAARQRDQERAEADLGHLELAMEVGALEAFLDRHGEVIDVAALDRHAAVDQGAHAVVVPGGDGDRQSAHAGSVWLSHYRPKHLKSILLTECAGPVPSRA